MIPVKKILSVFILITGLALVTRSVMLTGPALSTGLVAGMAFVIYGAARIYYLRGNS